MATKEHEKIIAFDTLFSTNHTQMLKILLPFMDNQAGKQLAVYIKFLELNYAISYLKKHPLQLCGCTDNTGGPSFPAICGELLPFCNDKEKKQIEQMRNIFQSMEMYREMTKTMEAMKDFMPNMGDTTDMGDMLMNMLTPEQKAMYEMFKGEMNHAE